MAGDAAALGALTALQRARSSAVADGATAVIWNVATEAGARDALLQACSLLQSLRSRVTSTPHMHRGVLLVSGVAWWPLLVIVQTMVGRTQRHTTHDARSVLLAAACRSATTSKLA